MKDNEVELMKKLVDYKIAQHEVDKYHLDQGDVSLEISKYLVNVLLYAWVITALIVLGYVIAKT